MTILFNKALLLAKIEATFDQDPNPDNVNDAFLVINPDFAPDITILERDNVRTSLSNDARAVGRKIGQITFQHEVRNNGDASGATSPRLGVLLRGCGMLETQIDTPAESVFAFSSNAANVGVFNLTGTTAYVGTGQRKITLRITTGGGSGVAVGNFTSPAVSDLPLIDHTGTDEVTLTDAVEILLHDTTGAQIVGVTPDFLSDTPEAGDVYEFWIRPTGWLYTPRSENFESLTLYLYYPDDTGQSLLHKLTGARGTFDINAPGGNFGTFNFTFTGSYVAPADVATPSGSVFETQKPQQVEQAALTVDDANFGEVVNLCAGSWTVDIANDVQPRECVNEPNSFQGSLIVGREPALGFDPEAVLEATHPFWANLAAGNQIEWHAKIGTTKGNVVDMLARNVQYTGIGYGNRNNIRTYEIEGALAAVTGDGDDELELLFA